MPPRHKYTEPFSFCCPGMKNSFKSWNLKETILAAVEKGLDTEIQTMLRYKTDYDWPIYKSISVGEMKGKTLGEIYEMFDTGFDEGIAEEIRDKGKHSGFNGPHNQWYGRDEQL